MKKVFVYEFDTSSEAWAFMHATDAKFNRVVCGYPSHSPNAAGKYTVQCSVEATS